MCPSLSSRARPPQLLPRGWVRTRRTRRRRLLCATSTERASSRSTEASMTRSARPRSASIGSSGRSWTTEVRLSTCGPSVTTRRLTQGEPAGELIRPPSIASNSPEGSRRGSLRNSTPLAYATTSASPITSHPPSAGLQPDTPTSPHGPRSSRLARSGSASLGLSGVEEAPLASSDAADGPAAAQDGEPDYEAEAHAAVTAMLASVAAGEDDAQVAYAPQSPPPTARRPSAPIEPQSAAPTYASEAPTYRPERDSGQQEGKERFHAGVVPYPPPASLERRGCVVSLSMPDRIHC